MDATAPARPGRRKGMNRTRIQGINRAIILEAALEIFSTYGFRGSTLDQIAGKAGMSKPNLLYYFPRKGDIYVTVLEQTLEEWLAPLAALDPDGDPIAELRKYIEIKLDLSATRPAASRLFANEIMHGAPMIGTFLETHLRRLVEEKAGVLKRWSDEGKLAAVDPFHLIFAIWATTQHYADFAVQIRAVLGESAEGPGHQTRTSDAVLAILLDGIRPR